jgi:hypothetical protein
MPTGYLAKALVGAFYSSSNKTITNYYQVGKRFSEGVILANPTHAGQASYYSVNIATAVPANVVSAVRGILGNTGSAQRYSVLAADANGLSETQCQNPTGTAVEGIAGCGYYINIYTSQTVYEKDQDTSSIYIVAVDGFDFK